MKAPHISPATVARLPIYVKGLESLIGQGVHLTSSQRLAQVTGVEAPQIRRDLSYLGAFGTPGVGYNVRGLHHELSHFLGISRRWPVALVGYGHLGSALAAYGGLADRNFQIVAIFDSDPGKVGVRVGSLEIHPPTRIPLMVRELDIDIGLIATPALGAQLAADLLVSAGVTAMLNFAPVQLAVPQGVLVRSIDVAAEMQILSFHELMRKQSEAGSFRGKPAEGRQSRPYQEAY